VCVKGVEDMGICGNPGKYSMVTGVHRNGIITVMVNPQHARSLASGGWNKEKIAAYLCEKGQKPGMRSLLERTKGTFYFIVSLRGRPRGRSVNARPHASVAAIQHMIQTPPTPARAVRGRLPL
jgi:hypothetical protein